MVKARSSPARPSGWTTGTRCLRGARHADIMNDILILIDIYNIYLHLSASLLNSFWRTFNTGRGWCFWCKGAVVSPLLTHRLYSDVLFAVTKETYCVNNLLTNTVPGVSSRPHIDSLRRDLVINWSFSRVCMDDDGCRVLTELPLLSCSSSPILCWTGWLSCDQ